ncbi:MAG: tetratricopeptide repeat protein [Bacteroidales bacterium]|nr:tetratricopeptide repeat protein [Bacteroidales bacterium]
MKKHISPIIAVFFATQTFASFEQGNTYFISGEYREAIESYMTVVESGLVSPELYFNLGNAFFRTGDFPRAILFYERARRLSPKDDDILLNLGIANTRITDRFEVMPDVFFVHWWKTFSGISSRDGWAVIFLVLVFISVLCLAWYFLTFTYDRKKLAFYTFILLFVFSGIALGSAIQQHREQTRPAGIIMTHRVDVSSTPQISRPQFTIHAGTKVDILDEIGNYYRIRVPDGNTGWISKNDLEVI